MFREVRLVSAPEVTQAALVGLLTAVHQHVPLQAAFMRGHVAALRAAMDLLVGVQMPNVHFKLHGVKCDEGAKVAAKLVDSGVSMPLVLEEDALIGAREITLRAVVGEVCPIMSLHVRLALKDGAAGVMTTFQSLDPVHLGRVSEKLFAQRALERTAVLKAGQWLTVRQDVVRLHVSFKRPALPKALTTGGARIAVTVVCLFCMHADEVAADRVPLHGGILAQVATVNLFTCLSQSVYAQLALAGEVTLAGGTLETGVRKM